MKLIFGLAAAAIAVGAASAQADDFEPSAIGPDVAAQLAYLEAPVLGTQRRHIGPDVVLGETIRRPTSFRRNPLLTLAEREALAAARAAEREANGQ